MIDRRCTCPSCGKARTASKPTEPPLLTLLAEIDRKHELDLWHTEMRATRAVRQAERARLSRASRQGWSTRLSKTVATDKLMNSPTCTTAIGAANSPARSKSDCAGGFLGVGKA